MRKRTEDSKHDFSSVQFSHSVVSDSLRPHESQHTRPPCPSPPPGVHSNSGPLSQWCHPAISSSVVNKGQFMFELVEHPTWAQHCGRTGTGPNGQYVGKGLHGPNSRQSSTTTNPDLGRLLQLLLEAFSLALKWVHQICYAALSWGLYVN